LRLDGASSKPDAIDAMRGKRRLLVVAEPDLWCEIDKAMKKNPVMAPSLKTEAIWL